MKNEGKTNLTVSEITQLLNAPDLNTDLGIRNRAMMELAHSVGIKKFELLNLKMQDVDLKNKTIRIYKNKSKEFSILPLSAYALKYLQLYFDKARPFLQSDSKIQYLFLTVNGCKINEFTATDIIVKYAKKINLNKRMQWTDLIKKNEI